MITVGVDLASRAENTGVCVLRWDAGQVGIERLDGRLEDSDLKALLRPPSDVVGLDVPLGWPRQFVELVHRHSEMKSVAGGEMKRLSHRATDRWVHCKFGRLPLSVSTDRIAYPALRAAPLLEGMPRDGSGGVVEVYPALALRRWGLPHRGYKGTAGRAEREKMVEQLLSGLPRLRERGTHLDRLRDNDNCLDSLVAALVARAAALDLCEPIPREHRDDARVEGWIHVPLAGSLARLEAGAT